MAKPTAATDARTIFFNMVQPLCFRFTCPTSSAKITEPAGQLARGPANGRELSWSSHQGDAMRIGILLVCGILVSATATTRPAAQEKRDDEAPARDLSKLVDGTKSVV